MMNAAPNDNDMASAAFLNRSPARTAKTHLMMTTAATKGASSTAVTFERSASPKKTPMRVIFASIFLSRGDLNIQSPAAMVQDEKRAESISLPSPLERYMFMGSRPP